MDERETSGLFISEIDRAGGDPSPQPTAHGAESPERAPSSPHTPESAEPSSRRASVADLLATIERMERVLGDLRSLVSSTVREKRQYEFSLARLFASISQALVAGLLLWALSDWVFGEPHDALLVKLAFAAVLQMSALTGFLLGREVD